MAQNDGINVSGITNLNKVSNGRVLYLEPTNIPNVQEIITMNSKKFSDMIDDLITWDDIQYKSIENSKYAYLYPKRFTAAEVAEAEQSIVDMQRRIESIVGDIRSFGEDDLPLSSDGKREIINYGPTVSKPNVNGIKSGKILGSTGVVNNNLSDVKLESLGKLSTETSVSAHDVVSGGNVKDINVGGITGTMKQSDNNTIESTNIINSVVQNRTMGTTVPRKLSTDNDDTKNSTFVGGIGLASVVGAGGVGTNGQTKRTNKFITEDISSDDSDVSNISDNLETLDKDAPLNDNNELNKEFNSVEFKNEILKLGEEEL